MAIARIKKGDSVKIISGSHKGKVATVQSINDNKVFLSGIGNRKRHQAANTVAPAGKRDIQIPIDISNLALVIDTKTNQTSRVGYMKKPSGDKVRIARATKKEIK